MPGQGGRHVRFFGKTEPDLRLAETVGKTIALSTEIAGVIMASPKNNEAPARPTTSRGVFSLPATGMASDSNAIVPPSPWLSARITRTTYFSAIAIGEQGADHPALRRAAGTMLAAAHAPP